MKKQDRPWDVIMSICEWIYKAALANLLWILFTLMGLVVLGIYPATVALFSVVRKWQTKHTDVPIWKTFKTVYFSEFKRANKLGIILDIGILLYLANVYCLHDFSGNIRIAIAASSLLFLFTFLLIFLYIFQIFAHFEMSVKDYIKNALFFGFYYFHITIFMIISLAAMIVIFDVMRWLPVVFGAVVVAFVQTLFAQHCFNLIEKKKSKKQEIHQQMDGGR